MSTAPELLRRALESFDWMDVDNSVTDDIRAFLAAETEAKPIGLLHPNGRFELTGDELPLHLAFPVKLYTKPEPARKPMTEEEIYEEFGGWANDFNEGVIAGIRFAERHHGIGGDDE